MNIIEWIIASVLISVSLSIIITKMHRSHEHHKKLTKEKIIYLIISIRGYIIEDINEMLELIKIREIKNVSEGYDYLKSALCKTLELNKNNLPLENHEIDYVFRNIDKITGYIMSNISPYTLIDMKITNDHLLNKLLDKI